LELLGGEEPGVTPYNHVGARDTKRRDAGCSGAS
jgi:hypothetical protein